MNYIELLNKFYDLLQETRISNNAQLLYYTLMQVNNKCSWSDWFARTNVNLSGMMCISEKAMVNARNELKQLGIIQFIPSKKRGECTKYSLLYPTKCGTKEVQKKYKRSTKEVQSADIIKLKHKTKTIKSSTNVLPENQIAELYNSICVSFPKITNLSEARKKAVHARLNTYSVDDFIRLFELAEQSDFLRGKNNRNWIATYDWMVKDSNMAKVLDGNYVNRTENKPQDDEWEEFRNDYSGV